MPFCNNEKYQKLQRTYPVIRLFSVTVKETDYTNAKKKQEAYINGYWGELVGFTSNLFVSAFKTNP